MLLGCQVGGLGMVVGRGRVEIKSWWFIGGREGVGGQGRVDRGSGDGGDMDGCTCGQMILCWNLAGCLVCH